MTIEIKRQGKTLCTIVKGSSTITSDRLKQLAHRYNNGHLSNFNEMPEVLRQMRVVRIQKAFARM